MLTRSFRSGYIDLGAEPQRLPMFDALRAAAAMLVFVFHYSGVVSPLTNGREWIDTAEWLAASLGSLGTNLLLLLSGYFVAQSMARGKAGYVRFVRLRLTRIYVPFLLVVATCLVFSAVWPKYSRVHWTDLTWTDLLSQLLLLPGLFPERPILTVTWTLSYIVAGYLLFPVVFLVLRRVDAGRRLRIGVWAAVVAGCFSAGTAGLFNTRFTYIPMGCLLCELVMSRKPEWKSRVFLLRGVVLAGAFALGARIVLDGRLVDVADPYLYRALFSGSGLATVSSAIAAGLILQQRYDLRRLIPGLTRIAAFGRTGYSFYLLHGAVVKLFAVILLPVMTGWRAPAVAYWLAMPVCWAVAALAAAVLYLRVELPLRDAGGSVWRSAPLLDGRRGSEDDFVLRGVA
ncbi:MAG: acyltransferase [Bryobacterales bacterium]|nr:acyltransferase [Bryobacterales bacterium]